MFQEDRVILTKEEALSLLPDDEYIHTFRGLDRVIIGADHERKELVEEIEHCKCEIGGPMCRALDHGLVVWTGNDPLFVKTRLNSLELFDLFEKKLRILKGVE